MPRYFTVEEANNILVIVRPLMARLLEIRQAILEKKTEIDPVLEKSRGNGGSRVTSQAVEAFEQMDNLIRQIQETGAEVKDINNGLLDFLALRAGRQVYLCWQYGEDQVRFWHDLDAGFAGRQPLD